MYIEELRSSVNLLMANLESLPVSKGGPEFKLQKLKRSQNSAFLDIGDESEIQLSKSDVVLSFTLEVGGRISCSPLTAYMGLQVVLADLCGNLSNVNSMVYIE